MRHKTYEALLCVGLAMAAGSAQAAVKLKGPSGLVIGPPGQLWVANAGSNQVIAYDITKSPPVQGRVISVDLNEPTRLAIFQHRLYVANSAGNDITVYDISDGMEVISKKVSGLDRPLGVALDALGNVYIANNAANNVQVFSPSGGLIGTVSMDGSGKSLLAPGALAIYGSEVFLGLGPGDAPDSVRSYSAAKFLDTPLKLRAVLRSSDGISGPTGFAMSGRLLFVANYYNETVTEYALPATAPVLTIRDNVLQPEGVAVDSKDRIYVSSGSANTISVYSDKGKLLFSF